MTPQLSIALSDLVQGLGAWRLWTRHGWLEVKRRYRRTALGPFWSTASLAVFCLALGFIWANLWHQNPKLYLPYLTAGMLPWITLSGMINEGCTVFIGGEGLIKQIRFPFSVLVYTLVWRNLIVFGHNILIFGFVVIWARTTVSLASLLVLPGLLLICVNAAWIAMLVGLLCTRFRDITQIVASFLQIILFVTPVMYPKENLGPQLEVFLRFNIMFHLIEIVRAPMLGQFPDAWSWEFSILFAAVGWSLTFYIYSLFRRRIAYWL